MTGIQPTAAIDYLRSVATTRAKFAAQTNRDMQPEWLAADLIERQAAKIERMRAALEESRSLISNQEKMLRDVLNLAGQPRSADEAAAFARLHAALRMIDEAMGETE